MTTIRYYQLGEGVEDYWRTDSSAPLGFQVEYRTRDGLWATSTILQSVRSFLDDIDGSDFREITEAEVLPHA